MDLSVSLRLSGLAVPSFDINRPTGQGPALRHVDSVARRARSWFIAGPILGRLCHPSIERPTQLALDHHECNSKFKVKLYRLVSPFRIVVFIGYSIGRDVTTDWCRNLPRPSIISPSWKERTQGGGYK